MVLKYRASLSCILFITLINTSISDTLIDVDKTEAYDKIGNLFKSSIEKYRIDVAPINSKLRFFGVSDIKEINIVELILDNYGRTTDDIVDIIVKSNGDVSEIIKNTNDIFQCNLLYIQDGNLQIDLEHFNVIINETKENKIKQFSENHSMIGYLLKKVVDLESKKYAVTIEDEVHAISIPVEALRTQIETIIEESNKSVENFRSLNVRELPIIPAPNLNLTNPIIPPPNLNPINPIIPPPNDNPINRLINDLRGSISTIAITIRDNLKLILKQLGDRVQKFYVTEKPKNALENIYVTVVNTLVEQYLSITLTLNKLIDTVFQSTVADNQKSLQRFVRDVAENEGFFRRLIRQVNEFIKSTIKSVFVTMDTATGSMFSNILANVQALIDGVIDRVLPVT